MSLFLAILVLALLYSCFLFLLNPVNGFPFAVGVSLMLTIASSLQALLLVVIVLVGLGLILLDLTLLDLTWNLLTGERSVRYCDRLQGFGCW